MLVLFSATYAATPQEQEHNERRSADYVVVIANPADSYASLAGSYLGDQKLAYLISEFNKNAPIIPGKRVVIPLQPANPGGLYPNGYQTVPVLCYHNFIHNKSTNKIIVTEEEFDRQMAYLKNNGYAVLTLKQLLEFIEFRRRPPQKSVVITIDDAWKTAKTIAYPILKKYGYKAVLMVPTDNIKAEQNSSTLTWDELRELVGTGTFEIGSHSISHGDMSKMPDDQVRRELGESQQIIKKMTGVTPIVMAYPYGVFNDKILAYMRAYGYKAGFTVVRGGNASFNHPYSLNRSMIFHSENITDFIKKLDTFRRE